MGIQRGIHHKKTLGELLTVSVQGAIVALILFVVAMVAVEAWEKEDVARVEKLQKHFYALAISRETLGPAAHTGVRPNFGESSEPKTNTYQDASQPRRGK